jgi:hypothetical protein
MEDPATARLVGLSFAGLYFVCIALAAISII